MDFKEDSEKFNSDIQKELHKAYTLYINGKSKESMKTLKKVCFPTFDIREWEFENNILMCEIKISLSDGCELTDAFSSKFKALLEKVRGLPSQVQTLPLELSIGLNYSFVLLAHHVNGKVMDSCFQAGIILTNNLLRAGQALGSVLDLPDHMSIPISKVFALNAFNNVLEIVQNVLKISMDPIFFDLVILNCWVLAVLWMSQHQVDAGFKMLNILRSHLEHIKVTRSEESAVTCMVDPSVTKQLFPISLLPCASQHGVSTLKTLVAFQIALYVKFCQQDSQGALDLLKSPSSNICCSLDFYSNYLIGLIFYETDKIDDAMNSFSHCINNKEITQSNRAAALSMIGCCLARKGKPNTAIAKLKEALSFNFGHLDALFYIAQQQHKLGRHDAEIQSLEYLCKAMGTGNSSDTKACPSFLQGSFIPFVYNLNGRKINLNYVLYWLGKRCVDLQRFAEASDAFIDVIAQVTTTCETQLSIPPYVLPSPIRLHRDCAFALLKAGKIKECVIVCDHAVEELHNEDDLLEVKDSARGKRLRKSVVYDLREAEEHVNLLELVLCKAYSVLRLDQPLTSLGCLQRVFDDNSLRRVEEKTYDNYQLTKRRKIGAGHSSTDIEAVLLEANKCKDDEEYCWQRIKSQAHMIRATILQNLDKEKESVEEFYQSILCDADNVAAVYQCSRLLFKLGAKDIAASNWIKYKELYRDPHGDQTLNPRSGGNTHLPFLFQVTDKELQEMDQQYLQI